MRMMAFSSFRLENSRYRAQCLSFVFSVIASITIVNPALCDPSNDRSKVFGIGEADSNKRKETGATDGEIWWLMISIGLGCPKQRLSWLFARIASNSVKRALGRPTARFL